MRTPGVLAGFGLVGLVAGETLRSRRMLNELQAARAEAQHDDLTGLWNRAGIGQAVETELIRNSEAALLLIDLDDFKPVNDTYGHASGDAVLVEVADRISAVLTPGECAGRHGGDEFSVLTPLRPDPWTRSRVAAVAEAVCGPMTLPSGAEVQIRASVGVATTAVSDAVPVEMAVRQLWEAADQAMYAQKERRKAPSPRRRRWFRWSH